MSHEEFKVGSIVRRVLKDGGDGRAKIGQIAVVAAISHWEYSVYVTYPGNVDDHHGLERWFCEYTELMNIGEIVDRARKAVHDIEAALMMVSGLVGHVYTKEHHHE
jgi:hypothetical protein